MEPPWSLQWATHSPRVGDSTSAQTHRQESLERNLPRKTRQPNVVRPEVIGVKCCQNYNTRGVRAIVDLQATFYPTPSGIQKVHLHFRPRTFCRVAAEIYRPLARPVDREDVAMGIPKGTRSKLVQKPTARFVHTSVPYMEC